MSIKSVTSLFLLLLVSTFAGPDEKEKTMIGTFKDINVFEFNVALIFEDADGKDIWFNYFDINLSDYEFYTIKVADEIAFPEYQVNTEKVGKKFKITYIEGEVEGEFSGEMEDALIVTNIAEIDSSKSDENLNFNHEK